MSSLLVFNRVYRLDTQSCWYFSTQLCELLPPNLPTGSGPPPLPHPKVKVQYMLYRQCMAGKGRGVLSCVGDHILQEFNTLFLTRFRT
jgi:hypothetical protein